MVYIPERNCQGVTRAGACTRQFRIDYEGEDYYVEIDMNINGTRFLKVPVIEFQQGFGPTQTLKPKANSKEPDGLYETIFNLPEFKTKYAEVVSSVKAQAAKDGLTQKAEEAARKSGTFDNTWQKSNPGTPIQGAGVSRPAANPGNPLPVPVVIGPGGPVELPDVINKLQNTADATIKSLNPPGRSIPVVLQYPSEGSYDYTQDHVVIEQFTYRAPQENLLTTGNQQLQGGPSSFAQIITGGLRRNSNLRDYIGLVKLPIPNQLSISNAVSWGEDTANPVEAGAFFGALPSAQKLAQGKFSGAAADIFSGFGKLLDELKGGGFGSGTPAGLLLSSFIAQYMLGKVGINVDPAQFIARGTGTTINPNLELLFNGPKLRSFSLSFEFAPVDESDAGFVRRIIRFFKQGMAPKRVNTNTIFIGSPNVFRITYRTEEGKNIKGLHRHKICALVACETNFTPDGVYQSYQDSVAGAQPVRTTMTLSFVELTPIFENDYRPYDEVDENGKLIRDAGRDDVFLDQLNNTLLTQSDQIDFNDIGF